MDIIGSIEEGLQLNFSEEIFYYDPPRIFSVREKRHIYIKIISLRYTLINFMM